MYLKKNIRKTLLLQSCIALAGLYCTGNGNVFCHDKCVTIHRRCVTSVSYALIFWCYVNMTPNKIGPKYIFM